MDKSQKKLWEELLNSYHTDGISSTIEIAKIYLGKYPKDAYALIIIGQSYRAGGKYGEALAMLRLARKYMPQEHLDRVYKEFGHLYRSKGNYKVAEKWLRKAVEVNPHSIGGYAFLGGLLFACGRFDEAKESFRKSIKFDKDSSDEANFNLGLIYRSEGRYKKAIKHFDKSIELDPDYTEAIRERDDVKNAIVIRKRASIKIARI